MNFVPILISRCQFVGNTAKDKGGDIAAIGMIQNTIDISNCSFHESYAGESGGAINIKSCNLHITRSTFTRNDAGGKQVASAIRMTSLEENEVNPF